MTIDEEVIELWFPPANTLDKPLNLGSVSSLTKEGGNSCFQMMCNRAL